MYHIEIRKIKTMTAKEVKKVLQKLNEFDFSNFDNNRYRVYKDLFFSAFNELKEFPTRDIDLNGQEFTRCRRNENNKLFNEIHEVWSPQKGKGKMGRLNYKGDPIFYAAHNPATALLEIRPEKEEIITCFTFKLKPPTLRGVQLGAKAIQKGEIKFNSEIDKLLYEFISKECKKIVPEDNPGLYCPTILFAKSFGLNNFDAFIYESVSARYNGINFAFKPEFVKKNYELVEVRTVRIKEVSENMDYKVQCICSSREMDGTTFKWKDEHYCYGHYVTIDSLGQQMDGIIKVNN